MGFRAPVRKLYYNMTFTLASVLVAATIGGIELLGLLAGRFGWGGGVWDVVASLNEHWSAGLPRGHIVRTELALLNSGLSLARI